jgi:uncharacterized membrane protein required for colicin V production
MKNDNDSKVEVENNKDRDKTLNIISVVLCVLTGIILVSAIYKDISSTGNDIIKRYIGLFVDITFSVLPGLICLGIASCYTKNKSVRALGFSAGSFIVYFICNLKLL